MMRQQAAQQSMLSQLEAPGLSDQPKSMSTNNEIGARSRSSMGRRSKSLPAQPESQSQLQTEGAALIPVKEERRLGGAGIDSGSDSESTIELPERFDEYGRPKRDGGWIEGEEGKGSNGLEGGAGVFSLGLEGRSRVGNPGFASMLGDILFDGDDLFGRGRRGRRRRRQSWTGW